MATTNIGSLGVVLSANISQFQESLKTAQRDAKSFTGSLTKTLGDTSGAVKGFIASWVGLETVKGVLNQLNAVGDLQDLANGLGVSAEKLQELQAAGLGAGVPLETFAGLLQRVQKSASDAAEGNDDLKAAFDKLGMTTVDLDNPDRVLMQIVEKLNSIPNAADKMAVAIQLGGKSGAQALMKLSADGVDALKASMEEARAKGLIMGNDIVKGADDAGDAIAKLSWEFQQKLKIAVVENKDEVVILAQAFSDFITFTLGGISQATGLLVKFTKGIAETVAQMQGYETGDDALKRHKEQLTTLIEEEQRLNKTLKERGKGDDTWVRLKAGNALNQIKEKAEIEKLSGYEPKPEKTTQYNPYADYKTAPKAIRGTQKAPKAPKAVKEQSTEADPTQQGAISYFGKSADAELEKLQKISTELERQKAIWANLDVAALDPAQQKDREDSLRKYDQALQLVAEDQQSIYDAQDKDINEHNKAWSDYANKQRDAAQAIRETVDPLEKQRVEMEKIGRLVEDGYLDPQVAADYLKIIEEKTKEVTDWAKEMGMTFSSAFEDAVVNGKSFNDVLSGILKDMATMVLRLGVINPLMEKMFGSKGANGMTTGGMLSGGLGGAFEWIKGIFGGGSGTADTSGIGSAMSLMNDLPNAKGNLFSGHITPFANGGIITAPTLFPMSKGTGLAGEAGMEGLFPVTRDSRGRMAVSAVGSGGSSVTNNYNTVTVNESNTPQETANAVQAKMMQSIARQEIVKANRVGGINNGMSLGT